MLLWLLSTLGGTAVGKIVEAAVGHAFGRPVPEAEQETDRAVEAARRVLEEAFRDDPRGPYTSFLDRDTNRRALLRSTFPRSRPVRPADIDPDGFDGAPPAPPEAVALALDAFRGALDASNSRELGRDRALAEVQGGQAEALDVARRTLQVAEEARDAALGTDGVGEALRIVLEGQIPPVQDLVEEGHADEAARLLGERVRAVADLAAGAQGRLAELLHRHVQALRVEWGLALTQAADTDPAREQLAALDGPDRVDPALALGAAKLAFNVRDAAALDRYRVLLRSHDAARGDVWAAVAAEDWTAVLRRLDRLERAGDGDLARFRAHALVGTGREYAQAQTLLDEAWGEARSPLARLAVAVGTADLVETVVRGQAEAPALDRHRAVRDAADRFAAAVREPAPPLVRAHGHLRAASWFAFLDDQEWHGREWAMFEKLDLSAAERGRLVFDGEALDEEAIRALARDGDTVNTLRAQTVRARAGDDRVREEAALQSLLDVLPPGGELAGVAERLLDLRLAAGDRPGARAAVEALGPSDPARALLAIRLEKEERGDAAARDALGRLVDEQPQHRMALRALFGFWTAEAVDPDADDRQRSGDRALDIADRLAELLPCREHRLMAAHLLSALGRTDEAIARYDAVIADGGGSPAVLRAKARALYRADRLSEAAAATEAGYDLDPDQVEVGVEAGRLWLEAARYDEAVRHFEAVAARHPGEPYAHANLGAALAFSNDRKPEALAALQEAARLDPSVEVHPILLLEAAQAAGDAAAEREAVQRMHRGARTVEVTRADDLDEADRLAAEDGFVSLRMSSKDSLRAFLEHQAERSEAIQNLYRSEMAPHGGLLGQQGRGWSSWLAAVAAFKRRVQYRYPEAISVRVPWPSEASLRPFESDPDDARDGLLVDITALLTLTSIGALDEGLRAARDRYGRVVLYPGALNALRDEVRSRTGGTVWHERQPYDAVLAFVREHALGPAPGDPDAAALADAVPEVARDPLGNAAPDVGLALHTSAGFVRMPSHYDEPEEEAWGGRAWTSAEVLAALHRAGHVGRSEAEAIAAEAPSAFAGWADVDPPDLELLVVSGFVLTDWYRSGLLGLWLGRGDELPTLRVGPFGVRHLEDAVAEREARRELQDQLTGALSTLDSLVKEGVAEALPEALGAESDSPFDQLWDHAYGLFDAAQTRGLHLWADDRAIGFLLWRFGTPVVGPEVEGALDAIRRDYPGLKTVTTERVLEEVDLPDGRAEALGWDLFAAGYRPLLGRLALRHLLREYPHTFDQSPFSHLFDGMAALAAAAPPVDVVGAHRHAGYINVGLAPILVALLDIARTAPDLSLDGRRTLAASIVRHARFLLDAVADHGIAGLTASRLLLAGQTARRKDGADEEVEAAVGDALAEHLAPHAAAAAARAVEDFAIEIYMGLHAKAEAEIEAPPDERTAVADQLAAGQAVRLIEPLLRSDLIRAHSGPFRRVLLALLGDPESHVGVFTVSGRGLAVPLDVTEDELERAALRAIEEWSGTAGDVVGLTRVQGQWRRPVPDADRAATPDLPTHHPVSVDVPHLVLALRGDRDRQEAIVALLSRGLDVVDPALRERVRELEPDLTSDDDDTREAATRRLAHAAVGSTALDLERGLGHAVRRLALRDLDGLEAWLVNPRRDLHWADHPAVVDIAETGRVPVGVVAALTVLRLDPELAASVVADLADREVAAGREQEMSDGQIVTALAAHVAELVGAFEFVQRAFILLYVARQLPDAHVDAGPEPGPARTWVQGLVASVLQAASPYRPRHASERHACVLRLAVHACSGRPVVTTLLDRAGGDPAAVAVPWTTNVLVAAERLGAFAADRYRNPVEARDRLRAACEQVGYDLSRPGKTGDRLNPSLFGPGLVDHERWLLLHALDTSWDGLAGYDGRPVWWSDEAEAALCALAARPEEHEGLLISDDDQNGTAATLDVPPSVLASRLLDYGRQAATQGRPHDGDEPAPTNE